MNNQNNLSENRGCFYELGIDYGVLVGLANYTNNGKEKVSLLRDAYNSMPEMEQSFFDTNKIITHYKKITPNESSSEDDLKHLFSEYTMTGYDMIKSFLSACSSQNNDPYQNDPDKESLEIVYVQLGIHNLYGEQNDTWVRNVQKYLLKQQFPNTEMSNPENVTSYLGKGEFLNADTLVLIRYHMTPDSSSLYLFVSDESGYTGDRYMAEKTEEGIYRQMAGIANHAQMQSMFRNASVNASSYDGIDLPNIDRFSSDKTLDKCMQAASYGCSFYHFLGSAEIVSEDSFDTDKTIKNMTFCGMTNIDYTTVNLKEPRAKDLGPFTKLYCNLQLSNRDRKIQNQQDALACKMSKVFQGQRKDGDWNVYSTVLHGDIKENPEKYRITDKTVRKEHTKMVQDVLNNFSGKRELLLLAAPGIGKTYSVRRYIANNKKGIFVYISPRLAITQEVANAVEEDFGENGLVLTTDSLMGDYDLCAGSNQFAIEKGQRAAGCNKNGIAYRLLTSAEAEKVKDRPKSGGQIKAQTYNFGTIEKTVSEERVAERLCNCAGNIVRYQQDLFRNGRQPELQNLMLGMSMQACGKIHKTQLSKYFLQIFSIENTKAMNMSEIDAFLNTFGHVTFMVDEISGDEGGLQIRKVLNGVCKTISSCSGRRITPTLIIADASMQDSTTAKKYFAKSAQESIFINKDEKHENYLYSEPSQHDGVIVNCCTYPAKNLFISYKTNVKGQEENKKNEENKQSKRKPKEVLNKIINDVCEICLPTDGCREEILTKSGEKRKTQCLIYIQNKTDLEQIGSMLRERNIKCMELNSNTDAADKAKTELRANAEDAPEVLLITSSGARGLSFKYVTHLFIQIPTFSICSNLMEIMQTIYRGRGDGTIDVSCNKYITFYLDLSFTKLENHGLSDEEKRILCHEEKIFQTQKKIDAMAMCLLMEGCIETRIFGQDRTTKYSMTPLGRQGTSFGSTESTLEIDKSITKLQSFADMENLPPDYVLRKIINRAETCAGYNYQIASSNTLDQIHRFIDIWDQYAKSSLEKNGHPSTILPFTIVHGCIIFKGKIGNISNLYQKCDITQEEFDQASREIGRSYKQHLRKVIGFLQGSAKEFTDGHMLTENTNNNYYIAIPISALEREFDQNMWRQLYKKDCDIVNCLLLGLRQFASIDTYTPLSSEYGFGRGYGEGNDPFILFRSADFPKRLASRFVNTEIITSTGINLLSLMV